MAPPKLIEPELYKKIASRVPVACVDLIIRNEEGKCLLVKRKNEPLKGQWWLVGGRIHVLEHPEQAAVRKAKEEVGLKITAPSFRGYYSDLFPRNAFENVECQTVSLVFECLASDEKVVLDSQSCGYKWADKLPDRFTRRFVGPSKLGAA